MLLPRHLVNLSTKIVSPRICCLQTDITNHQVDNLHGAKTLDFDIFYHVLSGFKCIHT